MASEDDNHDDREPKPLDPDDAADPGVAGGGGAAAIIYGDDEEAEKHGDRLAKEPDNNA